MGQFIQRWNQIGGTHFAILDITYTVEPTPEGTTLHLSSRHRLTTGFNEYGTFWTRLILTEFQYSILRVVKLRAGT